MVDHAQLRLAPYDESYLERSWAWLNDPETKLLTMTADFTREQQRAFFDRLPSRSDYFIWGLEITGQGPIGAAGIKNVRSATGEYWGYIGERRFRGQGLGRRIMELVEFEAIGLGLRKLILRVLKTNKVAIAVYVRAGFVETGSDDDVILMAKLLP